MALEERKTKLGLRIVWVCLLKRWDFSLSWMLWWMEMIWQSVWVGYSPGWCYRKSICCPKEWKIWADEASSCIKPQQKLKPGWCKFECEANVDVTTSQQIIRSSSTLLHSLGNITTKVDLWRQIHVKFASHYCIGLGSEMQLFRLYLEYRFFSDVYPKNPTRSTWAFKRNNSR